MWLSYSQLSGVEQEKKLATHKYWMYNDGPDNDNETQN